MFLILIDQNHFTTQKCQGNKHLTKVHEDWAKNAPSRKTAPPPESNIFPPILTIFKLVHDVNKTNILTNHVRKTATPPGGHVFQPTRIIFELKKRHIIYTNIFTK
ncbi:hypothetical protein DPMN_054230 [Dreissena polymorpha]|uniref:Uncharacterized protein n=1 Tax=Dreissena polymorpha TaxID=45954 RepID=A0A9D4HRE5_DREPO|nr:hypothetical protein DPMN_054230 [Dreissena polymorpha]